MAMEQWLRFELHRHFEWSEANAVNEKDQLSLLHALSEFVAYVGVCCFTGVAQSEELSQCCL